MFEAAAAIFQLHALARVHEQRGPSEIAFSRLRATPQRSASAPRANIHTVKAHVLERCRTVLFPEPESR